MPIKKLWTLLLLYRWACPAGVRVFHSVSPAGDSVRVVLMSKTDDYVHIFPCSWRCRHYRAWLDDSARILIAGDADRYAAMLGRAGNDFEAAIKAAVRRKGRRPC
jgi:hypothetical protein